MHSYDMDRFSEFVHAEDLQDLFEVADDEMDHYLSDDDALLKFPYRLLKQARYGKFVIPVKEGAEERRVAERVELRATEKARTVR